jgi:hypothetical protein
MHLQSGDVLCCLDANFSQKRRRSQDTDPSLGYSDSRFLPERAIRSMEARVAQARGETSTPVVDKKGKSKADQNCLAVPNFILDDCKKTFIAAQEMVAKASKNFYSDTGLMALLCRHDRVLWLVNLTTPGERQFYALSLIEELFQHLPKAWTVGVLYDIACQLNRSMLKVRCPLHRSIVSIAYCTFTV